MLLKPIYKINSCYCFTYIEKLDLGTVFQFFFNVQEESFLRRNKIVAFRMMNFANNKKVYILLNILWVSVGAIFSVIKNNFSIYI